MENLRERLLAVLKRGEATVRVRQDDADEATATEEEDPAKELAA